MEALNKKIRMHGYSPICFEELNSTHITLINAGVYLLKKKGPASDRIEKILSMVQPLKNSLYHYFESKEAFG